MKKRILSMLLVLALVLTMIPASALAETINDDNVFLKQSGSGKCTLTSAVMMLRRRAIIDGNADWESITESTLGSVAWVNDTGMRYSYSYKGMSVDVKRYSGMSAAEKKSALLALLDKHPEGIEIYDGNIPHAVLLTDYDADTDTFYCADPGTAAKRIKLSQSWNATNRGSQDNVIANITQIWYITNKSGGGPGLLTVKLDPNGGACSEANAYVTAEGTVKSLPTPTRNGYAFTGWFDAASGGTKITSSYKFTKDTTIYAQWQRVPCIMLDPCGGECDTLYVYATIDGKISSLPTPTMDGFRFLGWYDAPEGGNKVTTSTPVLKDITLYAQWKDTTIRGECGSNLKWSLNEDTGVLRITGSGEMSDYHSADGLESPWHDYAASIKSVVIGSGVKTVGNYAFAGLKNLKSVEIKRRAQAPWRRCVLRLHRAERYRGHRGRQDHRQRLLPRLLGSFDYRYPLRLHKRRKLRLCRHGDKEHISSQKCFKHRRGRILRLQKAQLCRAALRHFDRVRLAVFRLHGARGVLR